LEWGEKMMKGLMIGNGSVTLRAHSLIAALLLLASSLTSVASAPANAMQAAPTRTPAASPRQTPAAQQPAQAASPMGNDQALYLVRSTLLTLNDANRSGNYTVLRDLAAPDFQAKNTAADLAQSFADLRRRNFDLFAAALIAPQFAAAPALDPGGRVHLSGVFPTRPLQISFDMTFESVGGQWRLFAISVTTPDAPQTRPQM
jgi:hypothetical protein